MLLEPGPVDNLGTRVRAGAQVTAPQIVAPPRMKLLAAQIQQLGSARGNWAQVPALVTDVRGGAQGGQQDSKNMSHRDGHRLPQLHHPLVLGQALDLCLPRWGRSRREDTDQATGTQSWDRCKAPLAGHDTQDLARKCGMAPRIGAQEAEIPARMTRARAARDLQAAHIRSTVPQAGAEMLARMTAEAQACTPEELAQKTGA